MQFDSDFKVKVSRPNLDPCHNFPQKETGSSSRWGFSTKTQRYITLGFVANVNLPLF